MKKNIRDELIMDMSTLKWEAKYELGIESVDHQHHYFFDLIKRIADEFENLGDSDDKYLLLKELNAYARFHFISEENLMRKYGYPKIEEHIRLHHELIESLNVVENRVQMNPDSNTEDIVKFLVNWFMEHSMNEDKCFANFLQKK